jgi:hypothetical protein
VRGLRFTPPLEPVRQRLRLRPLLLAPRHGAPLTPPPPSRPALARRYKAAKEKTKKSKLIRAALKKA